jgi:hypothetical protein
MRGFFKAAAALGLLAMAAACATVPTIVGEKDLLAVDRAFAERARMIGPAAAYAEIMDPRQGIIVRPGVTYEGDNQFAAAFAASHVTAPQIWSAAPPKLDAAGLAGAPLGQTAPTGSEPVLGVTNANQVLLNWEPDRAFISDGGDMGVTSGRFVQSLGAKVLSSGRYVIVWRKDTQGRWRALIEIGNNDPVTP